MSPRNKTRDGYIKHTQSEKTSSVVREITIDKPCCHQSATKQSIIPKELEMLKTIKMTTIAEEAWIIIVSHHSWQHEESPTQWNSKNVAVLHAPGCLFFFFFFFIRPGEIKKKKKKRDIQDDFAGRVHGLEFHEIKPQNVPSFFYWYPWVLGYLDKKLEHFYSIYRVLWMTEKSKMSKVDDFPSLKLFIHSENIDKLLQGNTENCWESTVKSWDLEYVTKRSNMVLKWANVGAFFVSAGKKKKKKVKSQHVNKWINDLPARKDVRRSIFEFWIIWLFDLLLFYTSQFFYCGVFDIIIAVVDNQQ